MLGFVSKKKYEEIVEKNADLTKVNKDLGDALERYVNDNDRLNSELKNARKVSFDLNNEILDARHKTAVFEQEIKELKKTIQKLKTLCTRNGVHYSHVINKSEK